MAMQYNRQGWRWWFGKEEEGLEEDEQLGDASACRKEGMAEGKALGCHERPEPLAQMQRDSRVYRSGAVGLGLGGALEKASNARATPKYPQT